MILSLLLITTGGSDGSNTEQETYQLSVIQLSLIYRFRVIRPQTGGLSICAGTKNCSTLAKIIVGLTPTDSHTCICFSVMVGTHHCLVLCYIELANDNNTAKNQGWH